MRALASLGHDLALGPEEVARGMIEIVNSHMEGAIRRVTVEEGADPREAALVAFGGAGGLHATALGRSLGMAAVLVPPHPGVFSALGLLLSPLRHDVSQSVIGIEMSNLDAVIAQVEDRARQEMEDLLGVKAQALVVTVEARYRGQSHETPVVYERGSDRLTPDFEKAHQARNGFVTPEVQIEVVTVRVAATSPAVLDWRDVSGSMAAGWEYTGPELIEGRDATIFLDAGERLAVLADGTMEITW